MAHLGTRCQGVALFYMLQYARHREKCKKGGDVHCMSKKRVELCNAKLCKKLPRLFREYVESCRPPHEADPKKNPGKLPNLAGFCRFIGCGIAEFERFREYDPELAEGIRTALEDELISVTTSPTLLGLYLKKRLGYEEDESVGKEVSAGAMRLIFDHDIEEDGA